MWSRFLLALAMLLIAVPVSAQSLEGSWALRVDGAMIFRFDLDQTDGSWKGRWWRPRSFASDGNSFSRMSGPPEEVVASKGAELGGWAELTFPDPRPGAVPDVFRFRLISDDRAEMIYAGTGLAPYTLVRVTPKTSIGPWDSERTYRRVTVESLGLPSDPAPAAAPIEGAQDWSLPPGDSASERAPTVIGR